MDQITEGIKNDVNINYILENNDIFFDIGYKVLKNQSSNGFIKCNKVYFNGKIKLIYDVSKYLPLSNVINTITIDKFIKVLIKLLNILVAIKDNGFIEYRNILFNTNSIYLDINKLDVFLIYLPIKNENRNNENNFFFELKNNIVEAIKNSNLIYESNINKLIDILIENNRIDAVINELNNMEVNKSKAQIYKRTYEEDLNEKTRDENKFLIKDDKKKKGILSGLFSRIKEKDKLTYNNTFDEDEDLSEEFQETTLMEDESLIKLVALNAPMEFSLNIVRNEYIIGTNNSYSDGVISFNKAISRRHCKISIINSKFYITDLNSSNGTYLNGRRLEGNKKNELKVGDVIKLANSEFKVVNL